MKVLDRWGQSIRINRAAKYIPHGARVLDVGCGDGALFRALSSRISSGVGIDPEATPHQTGRFTIVKGDFPADVGEAGQFDAVVALAVLEHIPREAQPAFAAACRDLLKPGATLIVTVPAPAVDNIVHILQMTPFADGVACHQHYGFEPRETLPVFQNAGLHVADLRRFEFGLNHLFVFRRPA
ncbi:MAG: class I SAM-dependent methyltransferase [Candidatus Dormibacteraeota bacterium]|nr:class I SAM-dependent methyltransferase [Candidatus Dormibacteraeota bacterium]